MLRVVAVLLALGVGFDQFALNGKYTTAAENVVYRLLQGM
jgi:hypothetical protein